VLDRFIQQAVSQVLRGLFERLDPWIRRRLRALQLKQWKRGTTVFRSWSGRSKR